MDGFVQTLLLCILSYIIQVTLVAQNTISRPEAAASGRVSCLVRLRGFELGT